MGLMRPWILLTLILLIGSPAFAAKTSIFREEASFEKNLGQHAGASLYLGKFADLQAALLHDASAVVVAKSRTRDSRSVKIAPISAAKSPGLREDGRTSYTTNYFRTGTGPRSFTDVPHFTRITYTEVYPGIDLSYHITDARLEYDFVVAPGSSPDLIALRIEGADAIELVDTGQLDIHVGGTTIRQRKPVAYQELASGKQLVDCSYRFAADGSVVFSLGDYDKDIALVIDPVIEYSSLMGGSNFDMAVGVKVGPDGYIYLTGTTQSTDFPIVAAYDSTLGASNSDVFVAKVNPATGKAVYSTFLGGSKGYDSAAGLAVDSQGFVYVTGAADVGFPTTTGAYQVSGTMPLGFVAKLSQAGNNLMYSTYLKGTRPAAIALDGSGRAAITGTAGTEFATTAGSYQPAFGGYFSNPPTYEGDAFALLLNADGKTVAFATFLGGSGSEAGRGIAVDSAGAIIVAGETSSLNFPTVGAVQPTHPIPQYTAGFLSVLAADGRSLIASTYYGGAQGSSSVAGVAVDPFGNIVTVTQTSADDFPLVAPLLARPALATRYSWLRKGLVSKFARSPLRVVFSTFVGGEINCCEDIDAVAVDAAGDIYVSGRTNGEPVDLAYFAPLHPFLTPAYLASHNDSTDLYFAQGISRDGKRLRFKTALAQSAGYVQPFFIAAKSVGQLAVGGASASPLYPTAAVNGQAKNPNLIYTDAFAMSLAMEEPTLAVASSIAAPTSSQSVRLTATSYSSQTSGTVTFLDGATSLGTAGLIEGIASLDIALPAGVRRLTAQLGSTQSPLLLLPVAAAACTP